MKIIENITVATLMVGMRSALWNFSSFKDRSMNLPSFLWLWKIAAWSMGFALLTYVCLAVTGMGMLRARHGQSPRARWRTVHIVLGLTLVALVLGLLTIGIVGTLGHYGNLGHSFHALAGSIVVAITVLSAGAALQIKEGNVWARRVHVSLNGLLGASFAAVLWTGWTVVQKYLP
ncbi:DUF4079 domain-containing protein [Altericista sp. CCNU0014]|uniref:DUF4079 domain-containing protein n=1 Tax=Altericista sp. CCNU0014 TaxID=3082949 RepID=UPI00384AAF44